MPVKIWEADETGLYSRVVTGWDTVWTAEEHREDAEKLDAALDAVLDTAMARVQDVTGEDVPMTFLRAWAVGRAIQESGVLGSPALVKEKADLLWRALARKCRTGARSSAEIEPRWRDLRPQSAREPRREGGRLDYFEMCRWLGEQELSDAFITFGGHIRNVWQMLERPALRPIALRHALKAWLDSHKGPTREKLQEPRTFAEMMKVLRKRWPDRGAGSAKRPVHYEEAALSAEVARLLAPFAEGVRLAT